MTTAIKNVQDLQERISSVIEQLAEQAINAKNILDDNNLSEIAEKLSKKKTLNREYLITAHVEDKVMTNKVSLRTIDEFSVIFQFNKLARGFFRNQDIHTQFSQDEGNKVLIRDGIDIVTVRELVEKDIDSKTPIVINADQLLLVDDQGDAVTFEGYVGDYDTAQKLKSAYFLILPLPAKEVETLVEDSFVEAVEDSVSLLTSSLRELEESVEVIDGILEEFQERAEDLKNM